MVSFPCALVMPSSCAGSTEHCARAASISFARSAARVLAEQLADRQLREARIADVPEQVRVRQLLRLDHHVQRPRAVEAVFAEREPLHQVEHHQHRDALPLRRDLAHRPSAIRRLDRVDPLGLELRRSASVIVPPASRSALTIAAAVGPV